MSGAIGIITAMKVESETILSSMENAITERVFAFEFHVGRLCGRDVVLCVSGVGKVNAAACTQALIMKYAPSLVINIGVAGTATRALGVGDFAVGESCFQFDVDTSPVGDPKYMISGINKIYVESDSSIVKTAVDVAKETFPSLNVLAGRIGSSDKFIGGENSYLRDVAADAGAVCVDMESGSISQVAYLNSIKFLAVRTISDSADGDAPESFSDFCTESARRAEEWLRRFIPRV